MEKKNNVLYWLPKIFQFLHLPYSFTPYPPEYFGSSSSSFFSPGEGGKSFPSVLSLKLKNEENQ